MTYPRIAGWLECRAESFEAGRVHDENLAYLLGDDYVWARGWELSRDVFRAVIAALSGSPERLIVRAIVPLSERQHLELGAIEASDIGNELDPLTPLRGGKCGRRPRTSGPS